MQNWTFCHGDTAWLRLVNGVDYEIIQKLINIGLWHIAYIYAKRKRFLLRSYFANTTLGAAVPFEPAFQKRYLMTQNQPLPAKRLGLISWSFSQTYKINCAVILHFWQTKSCAQQIDKQKWINASKNIDIHVFGWAIKFKTYFARANLY